MNDGWDLWTLRRCPPVRLQRRIPLCLLAPTRGLSKPAAAIWQLIFWAIDNAEVGLQRLKHDLEAGAWHRRYADLLTLDTYDAGYRLVVAGRSDNGCSPPSRTVPHGTCVGRKRPPHRDEPTSASGERRVCPKWRLMGRASRRAAGQLVTPGAIVADGSRRSWVRTF